MTEAYRRLLIELRAEFDKGGVVQANLHSPVAHLDGLMDGTRIYVDPRPALVETLLHELLHRRYPRWSEKRVTAEAKELLARLSTRQVNVWYRRVQGAKRHRTPKRIAE